MIEMKTMKTGDIKDRDFWCKSEGCTDISYGAVDGRRFINSKYGIKLFYSPDYGWRTICGSCGDGSPFFDTPQEAIQYFKDYKSLSL